MTRNKQWDSILIKIEECKHDIQYIQNNAPDIPIIEIDIAMEKLSHIYERLLSLKLAFPGNEETVFFAKNSSLIKKIMKDNEKENNAVLTHQVKEDECEDKNETIEQTLISDTKQEIIKEEKNYTQPNLAEDAKPKTELEQSKGTKTLAETLKKEGNSTIADMMASLYKKKDIATLQQLKPIKDLKQAISINDKIMFIREIFLNDVDKYNTTLTAINSCQNLDEALEIIEQTVVINSENQAMQQLLELVYRRYM